MGLLRPKALNIKILLPLLSFLTLSCSTAGGTEAGQRPVLLWYERAGIVPLPPDRIESIQASTGLSGESWVPLQPCGRLFCYRVPARDLETLKEAGYPPRSNPPFQWIEDDIYQRRKSPHLQNWWNGYKDEVLVEKIVKEMAHRYPEALHLKVVGKSVQGRPLYALQLHTGETATRERPALLFVSAHHGNEPLSIDYVLDTLWLFLQDPELNRDRSLPSLDLPPLVELEDSRRDLLREIRNHYDLWFFPLVNPDGLHYFWREGASGGRKNRKIHSRNRRNEPMEGVDLNRNYPFHWGSGRLKSSSGDPRSVFYRGPRPASEPETRAVMQLVRKHRFILALSFHTYATRVLVPYTIDGTISPYPSPAWEIGEAIAREAESRRADREYIPVRNLYPVEGTDQDWMFHEMGTLAYIVEGSYHSPEYDPFALESIQGLRKGILKALEEVRERPLLSLQVLGKANRPIQVSVSLDEVVHFEGENRTTDPETGFFRTYLPGGGVYHLRISGPEGLILRKRVACPDSGICSMQLQLP